MGMVYHSRISKRFSSKALSTLYVRHCVTTHVIRLHLSPYQLSHSKEPHLPYLRAISSPMWYVVPVFGIPTLTYITPSDILGISGWRKGLPTFRRGPTAYIHFLQRICL